MGCQRSAPCTRPLSSPGCARQGCPRNERSVCASFLSCAPRHRLWVGAGPWIVESSRILGLSPMTFAMGYSEGSEGTSPIDGQTCEFRQPEPRLIVSLTFYRCE